MVEEADFATALGRIENVILDACSGEKEWPAQITAGVCAGVDFVVANPSVARSLAIDPAANRGFRKRYNRVVERLSGFIREAAPAGPELSAETSRALVGGIVGLIGDHLRVGRMDRLAQLRPELVLLALLPYLSFGEAQRWANRAAGLPSTDG
jgi:hypothetical protein